MTARLRLKRFVIFAGNFEASEISNVRIRTFESNSLWIRFVTPHLTPPHNVRKLTMERGDFTRERSEANCLKRFVFWRGELEAKR